MPAAHALPDLDVAGNDLRPDPEREVRLVAGADDSGIGLLAGRRVGRDLLHPHHPRRVGAVGGVTRGGEAPAAV